MNAGNNIISVNMYKRVLMFSEDLTLYHGATITIQGGIVNEVNIKKSGVFFPGKSAGTTLDVY